MRICNQEFADTDPEFRAACARAGVQPSKRRAARWRACTGFVYGFRVGGPLGPAEDIDLGEKVAIAS